MWTTPVSCTWMTPFFEQVLWPNLAERAKVKSSAQHIRPGGDRDMALVACGFSGHGRQHAHGDGGACAELLLHGGFNTLDLSSLSFGCVVRGESFVERIIY